MATNSRYTDDDRAKVFLALSVHQGNVKRVARETQVPITTVRNWKKAWEKNPPSQEIAVRVEEQAEQFVTDARRIRDKALLAYEEKVDTGQASTRDLLTGVGILTDKINIADGLRKKPEVESADTALTREIAKELVGALAKSRERETVVYVTEAEWEQADKALPEPEEV
jgi:transposase-like protein